MGVVGVALVVIGLMIAVGFVWMVRDLPRGSARAHRELRARYGLDRRSWRQVWRAVHAGRDAPGPLSPAGRDYAAALLDAGDGGLGSDGILMLLAGGVLQSVGNLLSHGVSWPLVVGGAVEALVLVGALWIRWRRTRNAGLLLGARR